MRNTHNNKYQPRLNHLVLLLVVTIAAGVFLAACGQSASDVVEKGSPEAKKEAKELALSPADVGQGAKPVEEPPVLDTLTECGIQRHLLMDSAAYAQSPKMGVSFSSFSSLVGLFSSQASAADAYRALTKKGLGPCYVALVRHRIELQATPIGKSKLVTHKSPAPSHGTEYEVITLAASLLGERKVFSHIVLVQDGPSVYLVSSFVLGGRDGFNPLQTTAIAAHRRHQAVFRG